MTGKSVSKSVRAHFMVDAALSVTLLYVESYRSRRTERHTVNGLLMSWRGCIRRRIWTISGQMTVSYCATRFSRNCKKAFKMSQVIFRSSLQQQDCGFTIWNACRRWDYLCLLNALATGICIYIAWRTCSTCSLTQDTTCMPKDVACTCRWWWTCPTAIHGCRACLLNTRLHTVRRLPTYWGGVVDCQQTCLLSRRWWMMKAAKEVSLMAME